MRRILFAGVPALTAVCLTASMAMAGNAHFIKNATSATRSGNNLVVNFKEAGLASGSVETVQASAVGTATYECVNNGGNVPTSKVTTTQTVTKSGSFTADTNGNIVGSLTLMPPGPGSFHCPPGQTLVGPLNVSYTNVQVTDLTSGASISLPGKY